MSETCSFEKKWIEKAWFYTLGNRGTSEQRNKGVGRRERIPHVGTAKGRNPFGVYPTGGTNSKKKTNSTVEKREGASFRPGTQISPSKKIR